MEFMHAPMIWEQFPTLVPGVMLVELVDGRAPAAADAAPLAPLLERARSRLAATQESDLPEIAAWRRAFAQMGMKPTQYRSAAEALLRRFRKEDALPTLHPLVDLCNAVSLAYALPIAAIDIDRVAERIEVCHADGDEDYLAFSGEHERPEPGEVIFADALRQVHARRWTFRQSLRSAVGPATRRALIVSEGLHAGAADAVPQLIAELGAGCNAIGWRASHATILTAAQPRWAA